MVEPNTETIEETQPVVDDFDVKADEHFAKSEQETPSDGSSEKETTSEEDESTEDAGADQHKESKSEEEASDADKEEVPKGFADHPKWQKLLKERNEAREALEVKPDEKVEEFDRITSSPEYVRLSMKSQGFTEEAIDSKLRELGHEVKAEPTDLTGLVANELKLDLTTMSEDDKAYLGDVVKISDIISRHHAKYEAGQIATELGDPVSKIVQTNEAKTMLDNMKSVITKEAVLDFKKDIEPALNKYMDENEKATQQDIENHFKLINHELSIDRLKGNKRQTERDGKKVDLRQNSSKLPANVEVAPRTGDYDTDADNFFDAYGINQ